MSKLEEKFSRNPPVTFDDILHFIKERFMVVSIFTDGTSIKPGVAIHRKT